MPRETSNFTARFRTLADEFIQKIQSGEFKTGEMIPSERDLGIFYNLSRQTIRRSLKLLSDEGWISSHPGKGNFVRDRLGEGTSGDSLPSAIRPPSRQIGLICRASTFLGENTASNPMMGLKGAFSKHGYSLTLSVASRDPDHNLYPVYSRWLSGSMVDGYILSSVPAHVQEKVAQAGVPAVNLGYLWTGCEIPSVELDYREIYRRTIRLLCEKDLLPCANIVAQEKSVEGGKFTFERVEGYNQGVTEAGLTKKQAMLIKCHDSAFDMLGVLRRIFKNKERPKSLVLGSTRHLELIFDFLHKLELKVPQDLTIVIIEPADLPPELVSSVTRFEADFLLLAKRAGEKLLEVINFGMTSPMHERYANGRFAGPLFPSAPLRSRWSGKRTLPELISGQP